jgi:CheY-like chemotaxis protein
MKKILVVDDEIILREYLTELLELENYVAIGASGHEDALRAFHSEKPDMIICDMFLGQENGFDLLQKLKESGPFTIPVIFMSAQLSQGIREKAGEEGIIAFIKKPYDNKLLLETIRTTFGRG